MSMKRTKQKGARGAKDDDLPSFITRKAPEPEKTWDEHMAGVADDAFAPYSLKSHYSKGVMVLHPKFGKGVVLSADGPRIDVLFAEGKKTLGHAPK